jgi:hypothetical protein
MTKKEELVEKIIKHPVKYAMIMGFYLNSNWDVEKLKLSEMNRLIDIERDLNIFDRNNKRLGNAEN